MSERSSARRHWNPLAHLKRASQGSRSQEKSSSSGSVLSLSSSSASKSSRASSGSASPSRHSQQRPRRLVARHKLVSAAVQSSTTVLVLYGLAGVGKTAVLRRVCWHRRARYPSVLQLDGATGAALQTQLSRAAADLACDATWDGVTQALSRTGRWCIAVDNVVASTNLMTWPHHVMQLFAAAKRVSPKDGRFVVVVQGAHPPLLAGLHEHVQSLYVPSLSIPDRRQVLDAGCSRSKHQHRRRRSTASAGKDEERRSTTASAGEEGEGRQRARSSRGSRSRSHSGGGATASTSKEEQDHGSRGTRSRPRRRQSSTDGDASLADAGKDTGEPSSRDKLLRALPMQAVVSLSGDSAVAKDVMLQHVTTAAAALHQRVASHLDRSGALLLSALAIASAAHVDVPAFLAASWPSAGPSTCSSDADAASMLACTDHAWPLHAYGLVVPDRRDDQACVMLRVHPLVQYMPVAVDSACAAVLPWIRHQLEHFDWKQPATWPFAVALGAFATAVADAAPSDDGTDAPIVRTVLATLLSEVTGRPHRALALAESAAAARARYLQRTHAPQAELDEVLLSAQRAVVRIIVYHVWDSERANKMMQELLPRLERVYGRRSPIWLQAQYDYIASVDQLGQGERAQEMYKQHKKDVAAAVGTEHELYAQVHNGIAVGLAGMNRIPEAKHSYQRSLWIRRRIWGIVHPDTLKAQNNYATWLHSSGSFVAAMQTHMVVWHHRRRLFGTERHHMVMQSMSNYAHSLMHFGLLSAASDLYAELADISKCVFGDDTVEYGFALDDYASCLIKAGSTDQGLQIMQRATAIRMAKGKYQDQHAALTSLGTALFSAGRFHEAWQCFEDSSVLARMNEGEESALFAQSCHNIGCCISLIADIPDRFAADWFFRSTQIRALLSGVLSVEFSESCRGFVLACLDAGMPERALLAASDSVAAFHASGKQVALLRAMSERLEVFHTTGRLDESRTQQQQIQDLENGEA